jgi:transcriptional regulator with XRE-family HTH domain
MTGQAVARVNGTAEAVSVAAGRKGFAAEVDGLRERMRGLGFGYGEIAGELGRRYRMRPREAYRLAYGWTLNNAAARFNAQAAANNTDPRARASMTGAWLCELEKWPASDRKPSVYVLLMLARVYETDVLCLLDLADHEHIAPQDRLVLLRRPRAETPFGEKVVSLLEARGLSLREVARSVPCDPSYLSRITHGKRRASPHIALRLDDVLDAGGELAALSEIPEGDDEPATAGSPRGRALAPFVSNPQGINLSLPWVPGRVVIEISGRDDEAEPAHELSLVASSPAGDVRDARD